MTTRELLRDVALHEFATLGYLGASLMTIAQKAGTSKSSVLYHFPSKEALLDAALTPGLDEIAALCASISSPPEDAAERERLFGEFVDTLMRHQQAVMVFLTQRGALPDVPIIERGNELIAQLAELLPAQSSSPRSLVRFSVGLAGVAFLLSASDVAHDGHLDDDTLHALLVETLLELSEVHA